MLLFDYLYLDDAQIQRHLGALSGGTVGPTAVSSSSQSQRGVGLAGGVGAVTAKVDRSSSSIGNVSFTIEPTPEARFQQLLGLVRGSNGWQVLDPMDDRAWDQIQRGMTIELHATLSLPEPIAALMTASAAVPLANAFGAIGNLMPQGSVDPATLHQINSLAQAGQGIQKVLDHLEGKALPFIATPTNGTNQRFVVNLKQQAMRVQPDELNDGPVTLTARVTQRVERNKPWSLDMPSMFPNLNLAAGVNREQRRKTAQPSATESKLITLKYPGALLDPLAITR
jgi:hypothetical protein